jgi:hypothetical protein
VASSPYPIELASPNFYLLVGVLGLFLVMFFLLRSRTRSRRALEAYLEATGISLIFLVGSVLALLYMAYRYPSGNHSAYAVSQVILQGYWLTIAIPVVTVGSSVHSKTRGATPWLWPSLGVAALLFLILYYVAYIGM